MPATRRNGSSHAAPVASATRSSQRSSIRHATAAASQSHARTLVPATQEQEQRHGRRAAVKRSGRRGARDESESEEEEEEEEAITVAAAGPSRGHGQRVVAPASDDGDEESQAVRRRRAPRGAGEGRGGRRIDDEEEEEEEEQEEEEDGAARAGPANADAEAPEQDGDGEATAGMNIKGLTIESFKSVKIPGKDKATSNKLLFLSRNLSALHDNIKLGLSRAIETAISLQECMADDPALLGAPGRQQVWDLGLVANKSRDAALAAREDEADDVEAIKHAKMLDRRVRSMIDQMAVIRLQMDVLAEMRRTVDSGAETEDLQGTYKQKCAAALAAYHAKSEREKCK